MGQVALVEVIMPTFNCLTNDGRKSERPYLHESLDSVFGQTFADFKVSVLDNLSDDGTWEALDGRRRRDSRMSLSSDTRRRGPEESIRHLVGLAESPLVVIANDDDFWHPRYLETLVRIHQSSGCDLAYTGGRFVSEKGRPLSTFPDQPDSIYTSRSPWTDNYRRFLVNRNPIPITFGIWRRTFIQDLYPTTIFHAFRAHTDNLFIANVLRARPLIIRSPLIGLSYRHRRRAFQAEQAYGLPSRRYPAAWLYASHVEHQTRFAIALLRQGRDIDRRVGTGHEESQDADASVLSSWTHHIHQLWYLLLGDSVLSRPDHLAMQKVFRVAGMKRWRGGDMETIGLSLILGLESLDASDARLLDATTRAIVAICELVGHEPS